MEYRLQPIYIDDFNYGLPHHRIAEFPLPERDQSKLLVHKEGKCIDSRFQDLAAFLPEHAGLFLNNTKVIEARIFFQKPSGGKIEIFCLEPFSPAEITAAMSAKNRVQWLCMIGGASKWKPGQVLVKRMIPDGEEIELAAVYKNKEQDAFVIEFTWNSDHSFAEVLHVAGSIPLPPYIKRKAVDEDSQRYQTIFAKDEGSVAAPTASLHFTQRVFDDLQQKGISRNYITLHVGAGTFKPVKTETIADHQMHAEHFYVTTDTLRQLIDTNTIIASGTTTLRTLESLHWLGVKLKNGLIRKEFMLDQWEAYELMDHQLSYNESIQTLIDYLQNESKKGLHAKTSMIIVPGYKFKSAKALITNFHQPKSTLLLLVAAFAGEEWKKIYEHALNNNYRFLSYGDSSLLWRNQ